MPPTTILSRILVLLCVYAGITAQYSSEDGDCDFDFDYSAENGPSTWGEKCPACNGQQQSPINIETSEVQVWDLPEVDGIWSEPHNYTLSNDGYTVTLVLEASESLTVQGGPLDGIYNVRAIQFCWGSNDSVGSEHTINGERFPLELQWILKRESENGGPDHEVRTVQLFRRTDVPNVALATISTQLHKIIQPGSTVASSEPVTYDSIFCGYPKNDYYHYNGSLTTPPCTEGIKWLVYPPGVLTNGVTEYVLDNFRKLMSENGPLVNNFRPVQELNGRLVVASSKSTQLPVSGGDGKSSTAQSRVRENAKAPSRVRNNAKAGRHGVARRHH